MIITVVFFFGLCGWLAAWAGLITENTNPNLYFLQARSLRVILGFEVRVRVYSLEPNPTCTSSALPLPSRLTAPVCQETPAGIWTGIRLWPRLSRLFGCCFWRPAS
jgi:hypothetical protein